LLNSNFRVPDPETRAGFDPAGREYVNVVADYSAEGKVRPVSIRFDEGEALPVTEIISVTHMSATKWGGAETRYYVRIAGREHYLYFEGAARGLTQRWFVLDCGSNREAFAPAPYASGAARPVPSKKTAANCPAPGGRLSWSQRWADG